MAGAAYTTPTFLLTNPKDVIGTYPIKSAEVINEGDLIALDSNGQVVAASKTQSAVVKAQGIAFFDSENGMARSRTGVAGLTVKCGMCKKAKIKGANATLVPSLAAGAQLYLGPVPTATVSNITAARSTTAGDCIQAAGTVDADGTTLLLNVSETAHLAAQAGGTSTVAFG